MLLKRSLQTILLTALAAWAEAQLNADCVANSGAILSTPASSSWNEDREVFNERINVQPAGVAYAHTEAQVQGLIQCARASGIKAVPRGGGHGYEGYAVQPGALTIDISNLTSFQANTEAGVATFGAGLRLGQLFLRMYEDANSLFPAGLCPWVGTAGHLLGGGTGLNSREYGLACDQIVSLNMIDYMGQLITANATQNADLLWASCGGGGGNLGIVTSFTVKLHSLQQVPVVTTIEIGWSGYDNAAEIFDQVQRWAPYADRRMSLQLLLGFGGVSLNAQFEGNQSDAVAELNKTSILRIPGTWRDNIREQSWINATLTWGANTMGIPTDSVNELNMTNGLPAGVRNNFQAASSYNQQLMSMEGINTMVNALRSLGSGVNAYAEHKMLLGAVSDIAPSDSAFYWRNSLYETQWMYSWSEGDQSAAASNWLNSTLTAMQPFLGEGAYINYPDPILAATSAWPQKYYGNNLGRYIQAKTKYDPTDYFSNPLTVQPSTTPAADFRTPAANASTPAADFRAPSAATAQVQIGGASQPSAAASHSLAPNLPALSVPVASDGQSDLMRPAGAPERLPLSSPPPPAIATLG